MAWRGPFAEGSSRSTDNRWEGPGVTCLPPVPQIRILQITDNVIADVEDLRALPSRNRREICAHDTGMAPDDEQRGGRRIPLAAGGRRRRQGCAQPRGTGGGGG